MTQVNGSGITRQFLFATVAGVIVVGWVIFSIRPDSNNRLREARIALKNADNARVTQLADEELAERPGNTAMILIAAKAAETAGQKRAAVEYLDRLPQRFDQAEIYDGWMQKAKLHLGLGQVSNARNTLQQLIAAAEQGHTARRELSELLAGCGYAYESVNLLKPLLDSGDVDRKTLIRLAVNGSELFGKSQLERLRSLSPSDPMPVAGLIAYAGQLRDEAYIRHLTAEAATMDDAILRGLLRHLLSTGFESSTSEGVQSRRNFARRLIQLLERPDVHPQSLSVTAEAALIDGENDIAVYCLISALRLDPWNRRFIHALGELTTASDPDVSRELRQLSATLDTIESRVRQEQSPNSDSDNLRNLCLELVNCGRSHEAVGWAREALRNDQKPGWAAELIRHPPESEWIHPIHKISCESNNQSVLDWLRATAAATGPELTSAADLELVDVAENVGLQFIYDNGANSQQDGLFMHQWTGGGVGVLDLDADSWPDLCFAQGGVLESSGRTSDALFRNARGETFVEVSTAAFLFESGFGQGVAVGDVNNDGFDDLCIGRIGPNILLINQGDGTFIAEEIPLSEAWTTSVAIADVNGDSQPDICEVNYLTGEDVFRKRCDHEGKQRICGPTDFPAAADRLLYSDGHGRFRVLTDSAWSEESRAGMGILVADIFGNGSNQIYIANDESPNQLLVHADGEVVIDCALKSGVAVSGFGDAMGSMGICLGTGHESETAIFVSNYYSEANNLYCGVTKSVFADSAIKYGLASAGYTMLGFGCQFADLNSDGRQDLVVANGHLDDFTHLDHPYQMRTQVFLKSTSARYQEATAKDGFLTRRHLGRSLVTLDWNRDSRTDFVVTYLDAGVSLVENRTIAELPSVGVQVTGVVCARDAVGTTARRRIRDSDVVQRITAGDGYQCSTEKILRVPVNGERTKEPVRIVWPETGASANSVHALSAGDRFQIIEGRSAAYSIPK